jgi:hypothetical protein
MVLLDAFTGFGCLHIQTALPMCAIRYTADRYMPSQQRYPYGLYFAFLNQRLHLALTRGRNSVRAHLAILYRLSKAPNGKSADTRLPPLCNDRVQRGMKHDAARALVCCFSSVTVRYGCRGCGSVCSNSGSCLHISSMTASGFHFPRHAPPCGLTRCISKRAPRAVGRRPNSRNTQ